MRTCSKGAIRSSRNGDRLHRVDLDHVDVRHSNRAKVVARPLSFSEQVIGKKAQSVVLGT